MKKPYFVCYMKKLGKQLMQTLRSSKCATLSAKEETTTTAGVASVKWSSKSLQGTVVLCKSQKFNLLAQINPQAQADTLQRRLSFDFNKTSVHIHG